MFTLKVFLSFAAAGFSTAFIPTALIPNARRLHRFTATVSKTSDHPANPSDIALKSEKTSEEKESVIAGAFEYVEQVTKGKLVVSFEPDDPEPSPPPPAPPAPVLDVFRGVHLPKNEIPPSDIDIVVETKINVFLGTLLGGLSL